MGVRTLVGLADGTKSAAVLFDSVTGIAFGPVIEAATQHDAAERAEMFLLFIQAKLTVDARELTDKGMAGAWDWFRQEEAAKADTHPAVGP